MEIAERLKKAKFGDKFLTRDGKEIILVSKTPNINNTTSYGFIEYNNKTEYRYNDNGKIGGFEKEQGGDIVSKAQQYAYQLTRTIFDYEPDKHAKDTVKAKVLYFANRKDAENFRKVDHNKEHKGFGCIFPPMSEYVDYEIKKIKIQ